MNCHGHILSGFPNNCWGEGVYFTCLTLNGVLFKNSEKTPYELSRNKKPSTKHLKLWGCFTKLNIPIMKKRKIGPKTADCVFVGYCPNSYP